MISLFSFLFINIIVINKLLIQTMSLSPIQCLVSKKLRYLTVGQTVSELLTHKRFSDSASHSPSTLYSAGAAGRQTNFLFRGPPPLQHLYIYK